MNISDYKSGVYKQQYRYKSFMPTEVNHSWELNDPKLSTLLSQADYRLGELNAYSRLIPNVDFFIAMHVKKEATSSSRIEGTQTNIEEVVQQIEYIQPERRDDWEEVQNYIKAMNQAINALVKLPVTSRLLKEAHKTLLRGVRGNYKQPGEFRRSQNWIGGASINDAVFVPPHQDEVKNLMTDLEKFLNNESGSVPDLIKVGIAHYQFETIHPFLDGNGRIGRLLITLYLVSQGLLEKPTLYLSDFFERHKTLYYDNLNRVRTHSDLYQWLMFFLEGVRQTSENSIETFQSIIKLREMSEEKIHSLGKKVQLAKRFLDLLYGEPIITADRAALILAVDRSTAFRLIADFVRLGILKEMTARKRNRLFSFTKYVELFE